MSIKDRVDNAVGERRVKTKTYDIKLSSDDLDRIYEREKRLEAGESPETLKTHLCRLTGVMDARVSMLAIYVTVVAHAHSSTWAWVARTITNFLEDAHHDALFSEEES